MSVTHASVIIVSRHRAQALRRCLVALTQQDHPQFEVIVVADSDGLAAVRDFAVKTVAFDAANISMARNLGLSLAAAPVVAFIDDDAVAEPSWLSRLVAGFDDPTVVQATGFVRGRNGISFQWQAAEVDRFGQDHPLQVGAGGVFDASEGRVVKTQGTNCAFRRADLLAIGGFDPAYRFYLDEADVNLRLMGRTAVVPLAQVHHGYHASAMRRADRVPLSLFEIAASTAVFLRRHAVLDLATWVQLQRRERLRAFAHRRAGRLTETEVMTLMLTLAGGWAEGLSRSLTALIPLEDDPPPFLPLPGTGPRPGLVLAGRVWQRRRLQATARALAGSHIVTLFCFEPTIRAHQMRFHADGYWMQTGGLFGRSDRDMPRFRLTGFDSRVAVERDRWQDFRPVAAGAA